MSLALIAIVLAIGAGAVVAVSTREPAAAAIGLAVALVAAALLADPLPSAAILGVRVVAALLVATLIRAAGAGGPRQPSALGWPAEALFATAGFAAGLGIAVGLETVSFADGGVLGGLGTDGGPAVGGVGAVALTGMALQIGAATMLAALGVAPVLHGRPGTRQAIGLVLVAQAVLLLRLGIAGPAGDLEEIARAAVLVACGATGAAMARAAAGPRDAVNGIGTPDTAPGDPA